MTLYYSQQRIDMQYPDRSAASKKEFFKKFYMRSQNQGPHVDFFFEKHISGCTNDLQQVANHTKKHDPVRKTSSRSVFGSKTRVINIQGLHGCAVFYIKNEITDFV